MGGRGAMLGTGLSTMLAIELRSGSETELDGRTTVDGVLSVRLKLQVQLPV